MKNSLAALAITLLVSSVASAGTLGLADSPDRYSITRNSIEIPSAPTALSTVESGDRIQANNAPVKVETTDGKMVLVGE